MQREPQIDALLRKAGKDFKDLEKEYNESLAEMVIREDLKVLLKNILENLRSCLDYLAREVREAHCSQIPTTKKLYFPIRDNHKGFQAAIDNDFAGLGKSATQIYRIFKEIQPYNDPWLGKFNKINNKNKHEDLAPQKRTEERRVRVSGDCGSVSWGQGVTFGAGVSVLGVPVDPRTQLPVPNSTTTTIIETWVGFVFSETNDLVLPFVQESIEKVERLYSEIKSNL